MSRPFKFFFDSHFFFWFRAPFQVSTLTIFLFLFFFFIFSWFKPHFRVFTLNLFFHFFLFFSKWKSIVPLEIGFIILALLAFSKSYCYNAKIFMFKVCLFPVVWILWTNKCIMNLLLKGNGWECSNCYLEGNSIDCWNETACISRNLGNQ